MNNKFNFLLKLFKLGKGMNSGDIPQLTNFLKTSQAFKNLAWGIHDFKKNILSKMDNVAFRDDPHNKPKDN